MQTGLQIWAKKFGSASSTPAASFSLSFPELQHEPLGSKVLYLADFQNQGSISKDAFIRVVDKFGSLDQIALSIDELFDSSAFFGFIDLDHSTSLLKTESLEEGLYVIRLNPLDAAVTLSIDYVRYGGIKTLEVNYHPADNAWEVVGGSKYPSLSNLISANQSLLRRAFYRQFPKLHCFIFDNATAQKMMKSMNPDEFLIRFSSSTPNAITAVFLSKDRKVQQMQITLQPFGKYLPSVANAKEYDTLEALMNSSWFKQKSPANRATRSLPSHVSASGSRAAVDVKPQTAGYHVDPSIFNNYNPPVVQGGLARASSRGPLGTMPSRATSVSTLPSVFHTTDSSGRNKAGVASSEDMRAAMERYSNSVGSGRDRLDASTDAFPAQDDSDGFPVVPSPRGGGGDDGFPSVGGDSFPTVSSGSFPVVSEPTNPHLRQTVSAGNLGGRSGSTLLRPSSPSPPPPVPTKPSDLGHTGELDLNRLATQLSAGEIDQLSKLLQTTAPSMPNLRNFFQQTISAAKNKK